MFIGANPQDLDRLAVDFDAAADVLDRGHTTIATALARTSWDGPDATDMRRQWNGYAKTRMAAAASGLREGAITLRRNADHQRRTSAAEGGGVMGAGVGVPGVKQGVGGHPRSQAMGPSPEDLIWFMNQGVAIDDLIALHRHMGGSTSKSIPWLGPLVTGVDIVWNGLEYGIDDGRTMQSVVLGGGGLLASKVPFGGVAWYAGTTIGTGLGNISLWAGDGLTEHFTGSTEGFHNSMWMLRNYGVASSQELSLEVQTEAVKKLNDYRSGPKGIFNMLVVDPVANGWWAAGKAKRSIFR